MAALTEISMRPVRLISCILFSISMVIAQPLIADTCPTQLERSAEGYWYSNQHPGWLSVEAFPQTIIMNPDQIGAIVFSPSKTRVACVYRSSGNQWVAIISTNNKGITPDIGLIDPKGQPIWKWSIEHQDYSCSKLDHHDAANCRFSIEDNATFSTRTETHHRYFNHRPDSP